MGYVTVEHFDERVSIQLIRSSFPEPTRNRLKASLQKLWRRKHYNKTLLWGQLFLFLIPAILFTCLLNAFFDSDT